MTTTFDKVADIISETSEIPREEITPESHTIDDLGIDSLDFLDIVFAIDKEFGIKIPLETWTQEVNDGKASTEEYFVMKNLCAKIDELVKAKGCLITVTGAGLAPRQDVVEAPFGGALSFKPGANLHAA